MCDGGCSGAEGEVWGYQGLGPHGRLGRVVVSLASTGGGGSGEEVKARRMREGGGGEGEGERKRLTSPP